MLGAVFTAACLLASTAWGQVALGAARTPGITVHRADPPPEPAPPPARPPHLHDHIPEPPAPGRDLFLAGPDTYARHDPRRPAFASGFGVAGSSRYASYPGLTGYAPAVYAPTVVETVVIEREIIVERERRPRETTTERDTPPAPDPTPIVIYAAPVKQKTLYVIPRCYAGDRRPSPDQLPAGCDLSLLKVIPAPR